MHLWDSQTWLMEPQLISKINEEGGLKVLQNLQYSALNRILSTDRLNRMLSTSTTLSGTSLSPDELIEELFSSFYEKTSALDDSKMALQVRFVERIQELQEEKKLNPRIKSTLIAIQRKVLKSAKKLSRSENAIKRNHFNYIKNLVSMP